MERVYQYLTGPRFRQRLEGIIEKFDELKEDLDTERKFMNRVWAKREKKIQSVRWVSGPPIFPFAAVGCLARPGAT